MLPDRCCLTHGFCGNRFTDVGRNPNVNKILETAARTKVARYREADANRPGTT